MCGRQVLNILSFLKDYLIQVHFGEKEILGVWMNSLPVCSNKGKGKGRRMRMK